MKKNNIKYSIVCASKNEEKDIIHLLNSFVKLNKKFRESELLIVDDSEDKTPEIIKKWEKLNTNIFYLKGNNQGCCEARNLGIKESRGEYIVFMTADSFFTEDFLNKIDYYYSLNFDAVMVNSRVANLDSIWSIFLDCWHKDKLNKNKKFSPLTTQGYSVKKASALKVGLIDSGIYKPNICRDWTLITKMDKLNMKKIFVRDIFCDHLAPDTQSDFIYTHFTRGVISAGYAKKFAKHSLYSCFLRLIIKALLILFEILVPIRSIKKSFGMIKYTDKKNRFFIFYCLYYLKSICFVIGEFSTFIKYARRHYT